MIVGEAKAPLIVERLEEDYNSLDDSHHTEVSFDRTNKESFRYGSVANRHPSNDRKPSEVTRSV